MKYSTIKRMEILLFLLIGGLLVTLSYLPPESAIFQGFGATWYLSFIGVSISFIIAGLYLDRIERTHYPQWERIWHIPSIAIVIAVVIIAAIFGFNFWLATRNSDYYSVTHVIIVGCCLRPLCEYYYARKFGLDQIHSLEELLQVHPEARDKLRKVVLGG